MADSTTSKSISSASSSSSSSTSLTRASDKGTTTIDDSVVAKIAAISAREVTGVRQLGGAVSGAIANMVGRVRGDEHATPGVGVEVGTKQAAVDITMIAEYPVSLPDVTQSVRDNVRSRIEELTGLEVVEVNIAVTDLYFPGQDTSDDEQADTGRVE